MNDLNRWELRRLREQQRLLGQQLDMLARQIHEFETRLTSETESQTTAPMAPPVFSAENVATPPETSTPPAAGLLTQKLESASTATELPLPPSADNLPPVISEPARGNSCYRAMQAHVSEEQPGYKPETATNESAPQAPEEVVNSSSLSAADGVVHKNTSLEMRLGTYWLGRLGIVSLLTGMVFLGNYAYRNFFGLLGAGGKISLLYLLSGVLLGLGVWLHRKQESLKNYAQVLFAGGLAAVFFTTYAAHHIPHLRIIESPILDGFLLLGWTAFMVGLADWKKSEILALFGIGLAYYTSVITQLGWFTLYSNLVLTVAAVFFLIRNRWANVSFISLLATYGSYGYWHFHQTGQWLWQPNLSVDDFWITSLFLLGYWTPFTSAVFLCRDPDFAQGQRTFFLSANNAAFYAYVAFAIPGVYPGSFWKFSLLLGAALLVLARLARRILTADAAATGAYLTQGLVLVTLGLVSYFTGLKLALVLAAESVVLVALDRRTPNVILQLGAAISAALATSWALMTGEPFSASTVIMGTAIGLMMLINAYRATPSENLEANDPQRAWCAYYTLLGFAVAFFTTWHNTHHAWRGVALGLESALFLMVGPPLKNPFLRLGAYPFAIFASCVQVLPLVDQYQTTSATPQDGFFQSLFLGFLMVVNAVKMRRQPAAESPDIWRHPTGFFAGLGLGVWLVATWVFTPARFLAPVLAAEASLFVAGWYGLRLPELTILGQVFLFLAQINCLVNLSGPATLLPWWNPVVIIVFTLVLSHWWQKQHTLRCPQSLGQLCQALYAFAMAGVLIFWLKPHFEPATWLALTSLLSVLMTGYGLLTRAWFLAVFGQLLLMLSAYEFINQLIITPTPGLTPAWYMALAPMATLALLPIGLQKWLPSHPDMPGNWDKPLKTTSQIYQTAALLLSLEWIFEYIPTQHQFWFLTLASSLLFAGSGWRGSQGLLLMSGVYLITAFTRFWLLSDDALRTYWPNFIALGALLAQQQVARRNPHRFSLTEQIHTLAMVLWSGSLWWFMSHWILVQLGDFYKTGSWAVLALCIFAAGFVLRERILRWCGLGILAFALGRVMLFDVWKLETIFRVLSFMALGVVLLVLGFIYNKYQDQIKQWL